jgi:hypothetical protein
MEKNLMMEDGIMSRYEELMKIFCSDDYQSRYLSAKNTNRCIRCGNGMKKNIDPAAELDYKISALCPDCLNPPQALKIEDPSMVMGEYLFR